MKKIFSILAVIAWTFSVHASISPSSHASNNFIEEWGRLKLVGNQLSDENGEKIQLKGWSTAGNFDTSCLKDTNALKQMKEWGATIVRLPQFINNKDRSFTEEEYKRYIDATADLGMYILADWDIRKLDDCTNCGDPHNFIKEGKFNTSATTFFKTIASYVKEKGYKHVLYEVCSEPTQGISWDSIKSYAEKMIDVIYENEGAPAQTPVVIVGTPNWSQNLWEVIDNQIVTEKAQIMYAFHLYANESWHRDLFDINSREAFKKIPVFISEWGLSYTWEDEQDLTDINKTFGLNFYNATERGQVISWCNWSWSNALDGNSAFNGSCENSELSPSGKTIADMLSSLCCTPPPCCDPCYGGNHFEFSAEMSPEELFKVSYYKVGGEGEAYHDENDTKDENQDQPTVLGFPGCQAGIAKGYCDFRGDECVDISICNGGIDNIGEGYYVGWISKGEWLKYCIDIKQPGYYYVEMVGNPTSSKKPMYISVEEKGSVTCDIDASTETKESPIDGIYFENLPQKYYDSSAPAENELMHWGWLNPADETGTATKNHGICLKERGEYDLRLYFPEGFGDMGSLRFTPVKAYTGEGWLGINDNPAAANVKIHYDASTEEVSVNAALFKMEVLDLTGKVLASDNTQSINIANLEKGIYIIKVYTEEWGIITNQILKR